MHEWGGQIAVPELVTATTTTTTTTKKTQRHIWSEGKPLPVLFSPLLPRRRFVWSAHAAARSAARGRTTRRDNGRR